MNKFFRLLVLILIASTSQVFAQTVAIGDVFQGGKVAYILQAGDPGYVAGEQRGLIVATTDQSSGIRWYNGSNISAVPQQQNLVQG